MSELQKEVGLFFEVQPDISGSLFCTLCGSIKTKKGEFPKFCCRRICHLSNHVSSKHKDDKDYIPYMYSIMGYASEKKSKFSILTEEEKISFFESKKWSKWMRMIGIKNGKDSLNFHEYYDDYLSKKKKVPKKIVLSSYFYSFGIKRSKMIDVSTETKRNSEKRAQTIEEKKNVLTNLLKEILKPKDESKKSLSDYNSRITFLIRSIFGDKTQLLWNSIILACGSTKQKFKLFNKAGFCYSKYFLEQKDGEEYALVKELLKLETDYLRSLVLGFGAVDNDDVKLAFALKKKHYEPMMQRMIFPIKEEFIARNLNLTQLLSGNWKNQIKINEVDVITLNLTKLNTSQKAKVFGFIYSCVEGVINNTIHKLEPFKQKITEKSFKINKEDIVDKESLKGNFLSYLKNGGVVSRQVLHKRCANHNEFESGFNSLLDMLGPKAAMIQLCDQAGHGIRDKKPTILVNMHVHKYSLSAAVTCMYNLEFQNFQKKEFFKLSRDTKKLPHGYLKLIQVAYNNYFIVFLINLLCTYCNEKNLTFSQVHIGDFVQCLSTKDSSFIIDSLEKEVWSECCNVFTSVMIVPILLKKSIREKNWELFSISRKLCLPLFFRSSHTKYFKSLLEECLDLEYIWSSDLVELYKNTFVLQTVWNTNSTYDERYENDNKTQKENEFP